MCNGLIRNLNEARDVFFLQIELEQQKFSYGQEKRHLGYSRIYDYQCKITRAEQLCDLVKKLRNTKGTKESETVYETRALIAYAKFPWIYRRSPENHLVHQVYADTSFVPYAFELTEKKQSLLDGAINSLLLPEDIVTKLITALYFRTEDVPQLRVEHLVQYVVSGDMAHFSTDEICLILFKLFLVGLIEKY